MPDHPEAAAAEELLRLALAQPARAAERAERVISTSDDPWMLSVARHALGIVLRDGGRLGEAVRELRVARALASRSGDPNRVADVRATLGIALALDGRSLSIRDTLGSALALADRKDEAIAVFTRLLQEAPEKADYKLSLARLYVQSKQADKARPLLDDLARLKDKFGRSDEVQRLRAAIQ